MKLWGLLALSIWTAAPALAAMDSALSAPVQLSRHQMRVLVQLKPGDIQCTDAHTGGFGRHIPGAISFEPMTGDTGWWWNKITDYDQRVTRIRHFGKQLAADETCADYQNVIPQSNLYVELERVATGLAVVTQSGQVAGQITETVRMTVSSRLTLTGSNTWTDWIVPRANFDPARPFDSSLINEFATFEQKNLRLTTDAQSGLECRRIENRINLVMRARATDASNEILLRRVFADEASCTDALTQLSQSLEARGRTWLSMDFKGDRRLWTTTRGEHQDCDTIRVERIDTEVEGLKFTGTNFIQIARGGNCR